MTMGPDPMIRIDSRSFRRGIGTTVYHTMGNMRCLAPFVVGGLAICSSSTVWAAEHLMRVDEVLISKNNDTSIQFVELDDPGLEPFPNNPYKLEIYNASGTRVGNAVTFTVAANTQRILVGTANADTAFGTTRDATLPATLPADGQACFLNAGDVKIMCLAWGCIQTQIVATNMVRAPSPPNDQSVQRQTSGAYQLATPTPDADNIAGVMAANCPTEPDAPPAVDGPISPDAGVIPDSAGAGADGGFNTGDDDSTGCCQVDGSRGAAGAGLLALGVVLALRRSRRKPSR
jgi:MYXO-CTERM domain-containing protein